MIGIILAIIGFIVLLVVFAIYGDDIIDSPR